MSLSFLKKLADKRTKKGTEEPKTVPLHNLKKFVLVSSITIHDVNLYMRIFIINLLQLHLFHFVFVFPTDLYSFY